MLVKALVAQLAPGSLKLPIVTDGGADCGAVSLIDMPFSKLRLS